jgi:hypothetical protein
LARSQLGPEGNVTSMTTPTSVHLDSQVPVYISQSLSRHNGSH